MNSVFGFSGYLHRCDRHGQLVIDQLAGAVAKQIFGGVSIDIDEWIDGGSILGESIRFCPVTGERFVRIT